MTRPFRISQLQIVRKSDAELGKDNSGSNGQSKSSNPFPGVGFLGRNEAVVCVEHKWVPPINVFEFDEVGQLRPTSVGLLFVLGDVQAAKRAAGRPSRPNARFRTR